MGLLCLAVLYNSYLFCIFYVILFCHENVAYLLLESSSAHQIYFVLTSQVLARPTASVMALPAVFVASIGLFVIAGVIVCISAISPYAFQFVLKYLLAGCILV